jgi:predicted Zn-dependent protease
VEVIANPYDRDAVRSQALTVVPGPVEYLGYDDGGTPDDESDDNHLYYLRWYALYSGRDASYGEIWLYDPDLERVQIWIVPVLQCVVHENCDGLTANPNGEIHGIIIAVPVSLMEREGTYKFVLHFYDNYADSYRNHRVKAALEVNATESLKVFHIEDDWMVTPHGEELNPLARSREVKDAFRKAGWIVHTAGDKCGGRECVLSSECTKIPPKDYKENLPPVDQPEYSRKYFYYYNERNKGRYVHVIGAAYEIKPVEAYDLLIFGRANMNDRYSYIFVKLHRDYFHQQYEYFVKQTVIHELGHQFGLGHHPTGQAPLVGGKFCVMMEGFPSINKAMEFCDQCKELIRNYNWK